MNAPTSKTRGLWIVLVLLLSVGPLLWLAEWWGVAFFADFPTNCCNPNVDK